MSALKPVIRQTRHAVLDGMGHARHKLHQLADNLDNHIDDVIKKVRDKDNFDSKPERIDVSVRTFKRNRKHDPVEFRRQHDEQMDALQKMSVADWLRNRKEYLDKGRTSDSLTAQKAARDIALKDKILELRRQGLNREQATQEAGDWLRTQAATHRLDGIAGGDVTDISGVGDSRINSSLGSQWRSRVGDIHSAVDRFVATNPGADLSNTYMNVVFR